MKIGSLFAGIGGLELGLERAGVGQVAWQVEIDKFCQRVLARHWPEAKRYGDIQEVDFAAIEPVDVICGGFPCQNVSDAGDRSGLAGSRSGLWREMVRAVRLVRPRHVVVENVAALLAPGRGMGAVLGDLAALGFDSEWDCLPAVALGAPHERDRAFVVAHAAGERREAEQVRVGTPADQPELARSPGGKPNPRFLEWVMGFPLGWTELDGERLAGPSPPPSPKSSAAG